MNNVKNKDIFMEMFMEYDGVYLKFINRSGDRNKIESLIVDIIFKNNINYVDKDAINKIINSKKSDEENIVKISSLNHLLSKDEEISIYLEDRALKAYIKFTPPINGGKKLLNNDIIKILKNNKIIYGIDYTLINYLERNKEYNKKYLIAEGKTPLEGKDGYITYFFNTNKKNTEDLFKEDKSIDKSTLIQTIKKGNIIARFNDSIKGKNGISVLGCCVKCKNVGETEKLSIGKNIYYTNNGKELASKINGHIIYDCNNNKIEVLEVLVVDRDMVNSSDNINFDGSVLVKGNVINDSKITATGNIEIEGYLERANLKSFKNIIIKKGIVGMNKCNVFTDGILTTPFIKNANIVSKGNIYSNSIIYSTVKTDGCLFVDKKDGLIVGGDIFVRGRIVVNSLGSSLSTSTNINIGISQELLDEYNYNIKKLVELEKDYNYLTMLLQSSKVNIDLENTSISKESMYTGISYKRKIVENNIEETKNKIKNLKNIIFDNKENIELSSIDIKKKLFSGVNIQIGKSNITIKEDIENGCYIKNINNKIKIFKINKEE